jgi:hypothetical protein
VGQPILAAAGFEPAFARPGKNRGFLDVARPPYRAKGDAAKRDGRIFFHAFFQDGSFVGAMWAGADWIPPETRDSLSRLFLVAH